MNEITLIQLAICVMAVFTVYLFSILIGCGFTRGRHLVEAARDRRQREVITEVINQATDELLARMKEKHEPKQEKGKK